MTFENEQAVEDDGFSWGGLHLTRSEVDSLAARIDLILSLLLLPALILSLVALSQTAGRAPENEAGLCEVVFNHEGAAKDWGYQLSGLAVAFSTFGIAALTNLSWRRLVNIAILLVLLVIGSNIIVNHVLHVT